MTFKGILKSFSFDKEKKQFRIFGKTIKLKALIIFAVVLVIIISVFAACSAGKLKKNNQGETLVTVERRDITNTVTGSAVIKPKDSYSITAIVTGEITHDFISEGDIVKKGDKLYQLDAQTAENNLKTAENAVTKAQQSYNDAVKDKSLTGNTNDKSVKSARLAVEKAQQTYDDAVKAKTQNASTNDKNVKSAQIAVDKAQQSYNDAQKAVNDLNVVSGISGKIAKVYVSDGEVINTGGRIADVYVDNRMKVRLPFNEIDTANIHIGDTAALTVVGTGDVINAVVTEIGSEAVATENHAIVKYVTMELDNPGALTVNDKATAEVNGTACNDAANFEYVNVWAVSAKTSGTVKEVLKSENDGVQNGEAVVRMESDSANSQLRMAELTLNDARLTLDKAVLASDEYSQDSAISNAKVSLNDANLALEKAVLASDTFSKDSAIKSAELSLSDAKLSLEKAKKTLEDYTITAPISGKVVTKNVKAGDKMDTTKSSVEPMCIIYDLSSMKFEIKVDEVDISKIKVGQSVRITADAIEGETFEGVVDNISINGTAENGVTTYPVTVVIEKYGSLMPGMNIDAEIIVSESKNTLAVPVNSVNRGNIVYVQGKKESEEDTAPDGFKSVEVKIGINDENYIEIKSGLKEGDLIKGQELEIKDDFSLETMHDQMSGGGPGGGSGAPGGGGPNGKMPR